MSHFQFQDIAIQEQQRIQDLRLRGGCDMTIRSQVIDEGRNARRADRPRMLLLMKTM
jgi:hypothetical protein